ncbi:hypothetical protein EDD15DRAFT_801566 [Pisolithus albus]|nr:hypothetical protein EDD15DRAFT_801566 [Pisolithus albus]
MANGWSSLQNVNKINIAYLFLNFSLVHKCRPHTFKCGNLRPLGPSCRRASELCAFVDPRSTNYLFCFRLSLKSYLISVSETPRQSARYPLLVERSVRLRSCSTQSHPSTRHLCMLHSGHAPRFINQSTLSHGLSALTLTGQSHLTSSKAPPLHICICYLTSRHLPISLLASSG